VVREIDPAVAVTVMVDVPAGVPPVAVVPFPPTTAVLAHPRNAAHASRTKAKEQTPINFCSFSQFRFDNESALPSARHKKEYSIIEG
jgi:hypothetical protein